MITPVVDYVSPPPDLVSWHTLVDLGIGVAIAFQSWLLKTVWSTRISEDRVRQLLKESQQADDVLDAQLLKAIEVRVDGLYREQHQTRNEVRISFENVATRLENFSTRLDQFMRTLMTIKQR